VITLAKPQRRATADRSTCPAVAVDSVSLRRPHLWHYQFRQTTFRARPQHERRALLNGQFPNHSQAAEYLRLPTGQSLQAGQNLIFAHIERTDNESFCERNSFIRLGAPSTEFILSVAEGLRACFTALRESFRLACRSSRIDRCNRFNVHLKCTVGGVHG